MSTARFVQGPEIVRPVPDPITSTLLDHATVRTLSGGFGYRNDDGGLWPSFNCLDLLTPTATCPEPFVGDKVFTRAEWQPSFQFAVYGGVECSAVGLDKADQEAEVKRVFERTESRGVEQALLYTRFAETDSDSDFPWNVPVDLTPAPVPLLVALALLEGDAAAHYAGLPTIHMPRAAATVLASNGLIVWKGDKAYTKNGSKVAMGGGYDDRTMLESGNWTMFATGEVYVEKSDQIDQTLYVIPGMVGSGSPSLSENTVISFAERMYRVAIDCYAARATGRVWS